MLPHGGQLFRGIAIPATGHCAELDYALQPIMRNQMKFKFQGKFKVLFAKEGRVGEKRRSRYRVNVNEKRGT
jgi:hypothetical protein